MLNCHISSKKKKKQKSKSYALRLNVEGARWKFYGQQVASFFKNKRIPNGAAECCIVSLYAFVCC